MCAKKTPPSPEFEAQNPLILRCNRLMEAFAKSDDERDFYIDRREGFLVYVDLDKSQEELDTLSAVLSTDADRYCAIPKLSYYEIKKIMEGFVNEKVYDIDTKEKLLDIIQSKEARENFLEFIYDHHSEQEKWQQYYQERSRIRIIEWLRQNHFHFVFEEDLELPRQIIEKLKHSLFDDKVGKEILSARKVLSSKAKSYYSSEALNPRPKRGRPPKQAIKAEVEPLVSIDIFTTVPVGVRPFLFTPEINTSSTFSLFSSKFSTEEDLLVTRRTTLGEEVNLDQKMATLRSISRRWVDGEEKGSQENHPYAYDNNFDGDDDSEDDEDDFDDDFEVSPKSKSKTTKEKKSSTPKSATKKAAEKPKKASAVKSAKAVTPVKADKPKRIMPITEKATATSPKKKIMLKRTK